MKSLLNNSLFIYFIRFLGAFVILFYGTEALIGITAPGGYYNAFIDEHLNFINWLRSSYIFVTSKLVALFGFHPYRPNNLTLMVEEGGGFRMVYSCLGYGVMSFWGAFIFANKGSWQKKTRWVIGGLLVIYLVNVARLALIVFASHHHWAMPLGWDHHTWFNIFAYLVIFIMIYFYDRSSKAVKGKALTEQQ